ncbi:MULTISPECIES: NACHT C-terminal helical domain 2-containing protein [Calothrix]|uniref:NACHT domain-containing NTPase n=2 Tax=Calothrix TaxID=1186 RepID=A0ABR8AEE6_9CYAN|nr:MULTISPECIES: NACHT domain-containing protein [Calothrix]MBD2198396.1 NACHT domain-containing NTPase [Calothrix parietina FACHB-288]MBD2226721.1 NACHT domain-containing NTPase [Calothrix anomala FACHB-343]
MVELDPSTINKFVEILRPFVESEKQRQSFLIAALGNDAPALQHISWGGSVATFIPHMLSKLADFAGREALCAVLEYARSQMSVHENVQQRIDKLIHQLNLPASTTNDVDGLVQKVRKGLYDKIPNLHGTIQLLDIAHPVEIDRLYVDVNILEEPCSYSRLEIGELLRGRDQREDFNRFGLSKVRERVTGLQAVKKYAKLMILGKPGSGKTTFLQHVAIECNQGYLLANHIPILILLRDFVRQAKKVSNFSLDFHIISYLQEVASQQEVITLLSAGKFLLLLDGLDEVPAENIDEVVDEIESLLKKYEQNNFIITCRVQAQKYRLNPFSYVEVADFNSEQIVNFIHKWFAANSRNGLQEAETKSSRLIELFNSPENLKIKELAVTPILLSLTCRVFDDKGKFYSKQSELYEQGLAILLSKWDNSRRIKRYSVYKNLSIEQKRKLLSYLAVRKFKQEQYMLFEQDEILSYIAEYLNISLEDSQTVLESIEAQHGLIVERAQRIYSFSHLTFQEYFAAKWFCDQPDWQILVKHISELRYREVFILATEISINREQLLELMKQEIDNNLGADKYIQTFLDRVNEKAKSVNVPYHYTKVRAFYFEINRNNILDIKLTLNILPNQNFDFDINSLMNLEYAFDCMLDYELSLLLYNAYWIVATPPYQNFYDYLEGNKLFLQVYETLTNYPLEDNFKRDLENIKSLLPEFSVKSSEIFINWAVKEGQAWADKLRALIVNYRNIRHNLNFFSEDHWRLLDHYYNANQLLVICLNSSSEVSHEVKKQIVDTLLLPITEIEKRKREK